MLVFLHAEPFVSGVRGGWMKTVVCGEEQNDGSAVTSVKRLHCNYPNGSCNGIFKTQPAASEPSRVFGSLGAVDTSNTTSWLVIRRSLNFTVEWLALTSLTAGWMTILHTERRATRFTRSHASLHPVTSSIMLFSINNHSEVATKEMTNSCTHTETQHEERVSSKAGYFLTLWRTCCLFSH